MSQTQETHKYLDPQTLASIAPLDLRARMIVEGLMTGMHRSPMQGFSVEFAQHRQYAPGDDTRFLDWKVYGKTDKLYIKQYQKETNLDMLILVDTSGSMEYSSLSRQQGMWRKYDYAATIAAAMAHLALKQQDRVGLVLFHEDIQRSTRISNAQDHWRTIVDALGSADIAGSRDVHHYSATRAGSMRDTQSSILGRLFDRIVAKVPRRSLLVLISDLIDDPVELELGLAKLHHRRHDLIIFQVLDRNELEFPFRQPSDFVGLEAEGRLPLDPAALRRSYLEVVGGHLRNIEQVARRFRFDYLLLDTSKSLGPPLSHFLAKRAGAISKA